MGQQISPPPPLAPTPAVCPKLVGPTEGYKMQGKRSHRLSFLKIGSSLFPSNLRKRRDSLKEERKCSFRTRAYCIHLESTLPVWQGRPVTAWGIGLRAHKEVELWCEFSGLILKIMPQSGWGSTGSRAEETAFTNKFYGVGKTNPPKLKFLWIFL